MRSQSKCTTFTNHGWKFFVWNWIQAIHSQCLSLQNCMSLKERFAWVHIYSNTMYWTTPKTINMCSYDGIARALIDWTFFLYCGNTLTPKLCVKLILGGNRQSQKGRNPFQYNSNDRKLAMMAKIIDFLNLLSRTNKSPHKLWGIGRTAKAHFLNWQRTHSI